jgi:CRP/FNR family cyclic AMP-dependent transcriptional regulator
MRLRAASPKLGGMPERRKSTAAQVDLDSLRLSPALRALVERAEQRAYQRNVLLIQEGDFGDTIYVVLSGRLKAFSVGRNDREVIYGEYDPGDYVGEMSLDGGPRSASVITMGPCICAVVTRNTLLDHMRQYPEFAFELLARVIRRARASTLAQRQLATTDVYGRLKDLLESLAQPGEDGLPTIADRPTQKVLAARLGCSREMVARVMGTLTTGKYVEERGRGLVLLRRLPNNF